MKTKKLLWTVALVVALVGCVAEVSSQIRPPLTVGRLTAKGIADADSGILVNTSFDYKAVGAFRLHVDTLKADGAAESLKISMKKPALNEVLAGNAQGKYVPSTLSSLGGATVTSLSSGNLDSIFIASVATATTTPALSYTKVNWPAHVWYGNPTNSATAPAPRTIGIGDVPATGSGMFLYSGFFGDSSDRSYTLDGTQGAVANVFSKSGSTYTLLKSVNFKSLTVDVGSILKTDGWQLFVADSLIDNGTIHNNGTPGTGGGNGGNSTANGGGGGAAGAAGTQGAVPLGNFYPSPAAPVSPKAGAASGNGCGSSNNTNVTNNGTGVIGTAGGASGVGSRSSLGGGNGSCAGGNTTSSFNALTATNGNFATILTHYDWVSFVTTTFVRPQVNGASAGSPGGSGGALSTNKTGGGGGGAGGGGSNGGIVGIYARILSGNGTITATGGGGGNGGDGGSGENDAAGYSGAGGGGGGGTAGNGGEVDIFVNDLTSWSGTVSVAAGTPGAGGAAGVMASNWTAPDGTPSTAGVQPAAGKVGKIYIFRF